MDITNAGRYCLHCGYPLVGLPSNRCPECSQTFDPTDADTYGNSPTAHSCRRHAQILTRVCVSPWIIVPVMWASLPIAILGSFAVIAGMAALAANLYRKRRIASAALTLVSPLAGYFAFGAFDYWRGDGTLRSRGLGGTESHNVNRRYRCQQGTGGCLVTGNEWITDRTYNLALISLISTLGPMRGSYLGTYPSKGDCLIALQHAQPVPVDQIMKDEVVIGDQRVRLDANVGLALLHHKPWELASTDKNMHAQLLNDLGPIQAVLDHDVLILRVPAHSRDADSKSNSAMIALIDPNVGRPFAYFAMGSYMHRFPPAGWRR